MNIHEALKRNPGLPPIEPCDPSTLKKPSTIVRDGYYDFGIHLINLATHTFAANVTIEKSRVCSVDGKDSKTLPAQDVFANAKISLFVQLYRVQQGDVLIKDEHNKHNPPWVIRAEHFQRAFSLKDSGYVMNPRPVIFFEEIHELRKQAIGIGNIEDKPGERLCLLRHPALDFWEIIDAAELEKLGTIQKLERPATRMQLPPLAIAAG